MGEVTIDAPNCDTPMSGDFFEDRGECVETDVVRVDEYSKGRKIMLHQGGISILGKAGN